MTEQDGFTRVPDQLVIWKPKEKGEALVGLVVNVRTGKYGRIVQVREPDGALWTLPAHKVLQSRLEAIPDPPGLKPGVTVLRVVYEGEQEIPAGKKVPQGYSPTEMYAVEYRTRGADDLWN